METAPFFFFDLDFWSGRQKFAGGQRGAPTAAPVAAVLAGGQRLRSVLSPVKLSLQEIANEMFGVLRQAFVRRRKNEKSASLFIAGLADFIHSSVAYGSRCSRN